MAETQPKARIVAEVIETSDPCGQSGILLAVKDGHGEAAQVACAMERAVTVSVTEAKRPARTALKSRECQADKNIVTRRLETSGPSDRGAAELREVIDLARQHLKEAMAYREAGESDLADDYTRFAIEALESVGV